MNAWRKLPVVVRAVILGGIVSVIGHLPPGAFYGANLMLWPTVPWSAILVILYLSLFWQWADGRWWPASTSESRRRDLRGGPLSPAIWRWSLIAGGLWMASEGALYFVFAYVERPRFDGFYRLFEMNIPPFTFAAVLLTASAVAGIVEEAAFRGFMQTPIERRHGPVVAILVVSVVFVLAHFGDANVPMSVPRVFFILSASVSYGLLTHLTGSILPGLVLHSVGDAFGVGLLWWFWALAGRPPFRPALGLAAAANDPELWLYCAEALVLGAAGVWAFLKLANARSPRIRQAAAVAVGGHP